MIVSVTLKEGGTWFMIQPKTNTELIQIINQDFYEGTQLFAIMLNLESAASIYDFVTKSWRLAMATVPAPSPRRTVG